MTRIWSNWWGIRKAFGDNVVLDGVDLSVARGEVIVIAGPSGSGKSTMLRCVNGLETVDAGEVLFDGQPVRPGKGLSALRAQIGFVFQQFHLFPHMTVLDNITLAPMKVKGVAADAGAGNARTSCSSAWASPRRPISSRPTCRADSSSGWRSRGRSPWTRS